MGVKIKKCRPILVKSNRHTNLFLMHNKRQGLMKLETASVLDGVPHQLVLISLEDEKIKAGDTFVYISKDSAILDRCVSVYPNGSIQPYQNGYLCVREWNPKHCHLVVVDQDHLSPDYISNFIDQYNAGCVEDVEIEMRDDQSDCHGCVADCYEKGCKVRRPKLTNGLVTILEKEHNEIPINGWEADLAIKNIPELPHLISSVRELRRYYIDGIQVGYNKRKLEELILYTGEEVCSLIDKALFDSDVELGRRGGSFITEEWFERNKKRF